MRAARGVWQWRRNPLRRGTDLAEAWAALVAALLIVCAAPLVGWATGAATHEALLATVRAQTEQRRPVLATVVRVDAQPPFDTDPETSSAGDAYRPVVAAWRGPDGSRHTGTIRATRPVSPKDSDRLRPGGTPSPGDRFRIWTDRLGKPVPRPLDPATASAHAVLAGVAGGMAAAGLVEAVRRLIVWRLMHRRYAQWDTAWERAGQDWGRAGADS